MVESLGASSLQDLGSCNEDRAACWFFSPLPHHVEDGGLPPPTFSSGTPFWCLHVPSPVQLVPNRWTVRPVFCCVLAFAYVPLAYHCTGHINTILGTEL